MEIWDVYNRNKELTGKERSRGSRLAKGEFHLVAIVWLKGIDGRFLISKRSRHKAGAGLWETTGGSAIKGETSQQAAVREVGEEIGLTIKADELTFLKSVRHGDHSGWFADYWCVESDFDIETVVCQTSEVQCVKWATRQEILDLIGSGFFFHGKYHLEALFNASLL